MSEVKHIMHGVEGQMITINWPNSPLFMHQKFVATRPYPGDAKLQVAVEVRFDDNCKNGHNTFTITGHTQYIGKRDWESCGCIHDVLELVFPELKHLIKWHHTTTDGPLHYVGNTTYHAGDRDCWGKRKGEPRLFATRIQFGSFPILFGYGDGFVKWLEATLEFNKSVLKTDPHYNSFGIVEVEHKKDGGYNFQPKYSLSDFTTEWHKCPFDSRDEAQRFTDAMEWGVNFVQVPTAWGEGKERQLDAARRSAVWPEATDEQLCLPREELTALLEARLPQLTQDFRADMEACGFIWSTK